MRIAGIMVGTAMVLWSTLAPIEAASKGKGPTPVKILSKASTAKTAPSPKPAKVTKAPKVTTTGKTSKAPKTSARKTSPTTDTKLANTETTSTTKAATSTTTPATTVTIDFTTGKVGERLTKNPKLAEKLGHQLTALGYTGDVYQAGYGFKNLGQLVATVNNAQNLGMPFEQLKTLMTGVSVDSQGVVLYANRNPDGTVTMVPLEQLTNPAPTKSLGQAKQTIQTAGTY